MDPNRVGRRVEEALRAWGYERFDEEAVRTVVKLLVTAAVDDGGTHLSLRLTDRQDHALVLVLSSGPHTGRPDGGSLLHAVATQGATDCGTESAPDGPRRWALLNLTPLAPDLAALPKNHSPERRPGAARRRHRSQHRGVGYFAVRAPR